MRRFSTCMVIALSTLLFASIGSAQQTATTSVPNFIRYSGTLKDAETAAASSATVGVTFAIYKQQEGGAPIWMETQNVPPDKNGQYSVLLGSTTATGLPSDLFSQQEERWLGVQVQGQAEQPRVVLVSVPYAFKAHEAETLAGLPVSAFLRVPTQDQSSTANDNSPNESLRIKPGYLNGRGTTNYVPVWLNPYILGSSAIYQKGGNVGIGTTSPKATLDVNGSINVTGSGVLGGPLTAGTLYTNLLVGTSGALELLVTNGVFEMQYAVDGVNNIASVNMIGGYGGNSVPSGVTGATIGGGGTGGGANQVAATFGTVGGGGNNTAGGYGSTVGGGYYNSAIGIYSIVGGGGANTASGDGSSVGGGYQNTASQQYSTVGGGEENTASEYYSIIGGGYANTASGGYSIVGGGVGNTASGDYSIVGGGEENTAMSKYSAILGGYQNTASASYTVAFGRNAKAQYPGSLVWGDSSNFPVKDTGPNQFVARATGGVEFRTAIDAQGNSLAGVHLAAGSGAWSSLSDRASKDDFAAVDGAQLLVCLDEIPLMSWHYKAQAPEIRHLGPVAQDFRAAFGLGEDDKHISTVDADGVALAAIQALYRQVKQLQQERDALAEQLQRKTEQLQQQNTEFQERLTRLEGLVRAQAPTVAQTRE